MLTPTLRVKLLAGEGHITDLRKIEKKEEEETNTTLVPFQRTADCCRDSCFTSAVRLRDSERAFAQAPRPASAASSTRKVTLRFQNTYTS